MSTACQNWESRYKKKVENKIVGLELPMLVNMTGFLMQLCICGHEYIMDLNNPVKMLIIPIDEIQ